MYEEEPDYMPPARQQPKESAVKAILAVLLEALAPHVFQFFVGLGRIVLILTLIGVVIAPFALLMYAVDNHITWLAIMVVCIPVIMLIYSIGAD